MYRDSKRTRMERCSFRRGAGGIETGSGRNLSGFRHRFEQKWEGRTKNKWCNLKRMVGEVEDREGMGLDVTNM
jgi:hypothetical protein